MIFTLEELKKFINTVEQCADVQSIKIREGIALVNFPNDRYLVYDASNVCPWRHEDRSQSEYFRVGSGRTALQAIINCYTSRPIPVPQEQQIEATANA